MKGYTDLIVMARKPFKGSVAQNVLEWGTGGINIDECRIGTTDSFGGGKKASKIFDGDAGYNGEGWEPGSELGRFPANFILDTEMGKILDEQSGIKGGNNKGAYTYKDNEYQVEGFINNIKPNSPSNYGDTGGASRFFYNSDNELKQTHNNNKQMKVQLYNDDCLIALKELEDNSVDSIVTDPPYHLTSITKRFGKEGSSPAQFGTDGLYQRASKGFMGKEWDGGDIAFRTEVWKECMRVLKPGGHLLAFGGTRTYHRMTVAIEDSGFEIRDCIFWCYGSGFPKSHNIGKAVDKIAGRGGIDFIKIKNDLKELYKKSGKTNTQISKECGFNAAGYIKTESNKPDPWVDTLPTLEKWNIISNVIGCSKKDKKKFDEIFSSDERELIGKKESACFNKEEKERHTIGSSKQIQVDITKGNSPYEGWGTALKPAVEPVVMGRKPFKGSVAQNVLEWGTGGINIDGCRVGSEEHSYSINGNIKSGNFGNGANQPAEEREHKTVEGRFPANLILDEEAGKILDEQSGITKSSKRGAHNNKKTEHTNTYTPPQAMYSDENTYGDTGGASRFFYCPKTSKKERNEGLDGFEEKKSRKWRDDKGMKLTGSGNPRNEMSKNFHPTVKPVNLLQYLIRLVTPKGGTVLDPFMGSGSTGKACMKEGMDFIGIEKEEEYYKIAEARIQWEKKNNKHNTFFE